MNGDRIRENRLRRMAARQGLRLLKSHLRDPFATGYGKYALADLETGTVVVGELNTAKSLKLDQIEAYLRHEDEIETA